jgi:transcriptional regulator with XRE-family HTH domain
MVRRRESVSQRTIARRLGITLDEVKDQELETADIPISILHKWREVLDVPMIELLADPDDSLSPPLRKRAQLVRVMKTAKAILERIEQTPVKRLAQRLVDQLTEIMPELRDVTSWHRVGRRRRLNEYGRAAEFSMPEDVFLSRRD